MARPMRLDQKRLEYTAWMVRHEPGFMKITHETSGATDGDVRRALRRLYRGGDRIVFTNIGNPNLVAAVHEAMFDL